MLANPLRLQAKDAMFFTAGSDVANLGSPSASMLFQAQNTGMAVQFGDSFGAVAESAIFVALNSM